VSIEGTDRRNQHYADPDSVVWQRINSLYWENMGRSLINDWALERDRFWQVAPKEMLSRLPQPLSDREEEKRA